MSDISRLSRRLIPCLDVRDGRLTKGIKFEGNVDIGDPVETARRYYEEGADEIVFYDITASHESRGISSMSWSAWQAVSSFPFPWAAAFPRSSRCAPCSLPVRKKSR